MNQKLLSLTPKRFLCPYCGRWHVWKVPDKLGDYDCESYKTSFCCTSDPVGIERGSYKLFFEDGYCHYATEQICRRASLDLHGTIKIDSITESSDKPIVTFKVPFVPSSPVGSYSCANCHFRSVCNLVNLAHEGYDIQMEITLGFEFDSSEYYKYADVHQKAKSENVKQKKEATTMAEATKKTSIKAQLWEKSPKENFEIIKAWAEKYKPVLRWAIPVGAVYGAYRILNSGEFDLSVNNIADTCEKQLGFKVEFLENRKALKELMVLGGLSAGAYGAMKAVTSILGAKDEDCSVEEVEAGMNQLESVSKKFAWIQPKTEDMLPIALSVILVYVALHKPNPNGKIANKVSDFTEDLKIRFDTYIELAKLFIEDKFKMDLSTEEDQKKLRICGFLVAFMAVFAFLYGKKAFESKKASEEEKEESKEQESSLGTYIKQIKEILKKVAPTVYTALFTFLASKKILELEEPLELSEEVEEESQQKSKKKTVRRPRKKPAEKSNKEVAEKPVEEPEGEPDEDPAETEAEEIPEGKAEEEQDKEAEEESVEE